MWDMAISNIYPVYMYSNFGNQGGGLLKTEIFRINSPGWFFLGTKAIMHGNNPENDANGSRKILVIANSSLFELHVVSHHQ